jgi:integrase
MPRKPRIPTYRLHKASRQAVVVLRGTSVYLGRWNSPESRAEYSRVVAEWLANDQSLPAPAPGRPASPAGGAAPPLTVNELILAFWQHAEKYYRHPDGAPTGEADNFRYALRPLRLMYGHAPAAEFGPLALRAVREEMIRSGLSRAVINDRVKRVRRAFRWAASMQLIPVTVVEALDTVPSLHRGRCDAPESDGVGPVDWASVDATLPHLSRPVAAMVRLMRYSNCRAEDVVIMRACDLQMHGDVWLYRPHTHKNQWRVKTGTRPSAHERVVHLGPRCQAVLRPFLDGDPQTYLFSPRASRAEYQARRAAERKTRRTPSELLRRRKAKPRRAPKDRFTVNSLQQAVRRACKKAGVPVWTLLQVRHARATEVREGYGVEGAAASLGDTVEAAQIYAERDRKLAERIAREVG